MEGFLFACAAIAALVIVDMLALAFGIDSRDGFTNSHREIR
jgi:hypothetical protein